MSGPAAGAPGPSPGEAYDRHVGRYGAQLADEMIAISGHAFWRKVLDVGCGPGQLTVKLAKALGPTRVVGIDPSEAFVAACRERVPRADIRVGVAEKLPFADEQFEATFAQLSLSAMRDPDAALNEMVRVTWREGPIVACVWDALEMPLLNAFWDSALSVAPGRAGAFDEHQRVGYRDPAELAERWWEAGMLDVITGGHRVRAEYDDFDDLFAPFAAGVGNSGALFRSLDEGPRFRIRAETFERLGSPMGPFSLTARALWVRGLAP